MSMPLVAIVGRPNVGKSSLLNAIAGRLIAIVDPTPGVTRDRVSIRVEHEGRWFELVDTGGIGIVDHDDLESHVGRQIDFALDTADLLLFVTDVRDGVTPLDLEVAERLRKLGKPLILIGNKVDSRTQEELLGELFALGMGEPMPSSARERFGTADILDRIVELLPEGGEEPEADDFALKLAIVGKPNAGKSTLLNQLAGEERVITSAVAGTTRDAVDTRIEWKGRQIIAIDTAGLKKKKQVQGSVAFYGQERAERAIRRSNAVLLMLDASEEFSQVDRKIASLVRDSKKPCALVINKWDLAAERGIDTESYLPYIEENMPGLGFAPVAFLSARDGINIEGTLDLIWKLWEQAGARVGTGEINRVVEEAWAARKPRVKKNRLPKIYYATQTDVRPPTIVLFVNEPNLFSANYLRYLTNRFRKALPYEEVPIQILLRKSGEKRDAERAALGFAAGAQRLKNKAAERRANKPRRNKKKR